MAHHAGFDKRAAHEGSANGEVTVILDEMHGIEGDSVPFLSCQPVDEDLLTFLNFKLLTGDGNDCEHIDSQKIGEKNTPFSQRAGKGKAQVWKIQDSILFNGKKQKPQRWRRHVCGFNACDFTC